MTTRLMIAMVICLMLAAGTVQAGGDAARGAELAADCGACHGEDGNNPKIAGMDKASFVAALQGYKSGEREDESGMMADYAADLSEQDMADLAAPDPARWGRVAGNDFHER
jgi:cytochrome c553